MDPLSIAASAAGAAGLCIRVTSTIYSFVDDTRNVDTSVGDLLQEIAGLTRVLESISQAWLRNPMIVSAQAHSDGNLWGSVQSNLGDCRTTLEKFEKKLDEVQSGGFLGRSFLRKPAKQIKLNMNMKDILAYRRRVSWHNNSMQSALQLINVCLALQGNASQEAVAQTLNKLKSQIGRVEYAVQVRGAVTLDEEDARVSHNMKELVRAADSFHSNASSIVGDRARSTVWGGSVLGDPLSEERLVDIRNWIPPPTIEEESRSNAEPSTTGTSTTGTSTDVPRTQSDESDADSDIEMSLMKRFEELAIKSLDDKEYEKAEAFLKKIVDRSKDNEVTEDKLVNTNVTLAFAYGAQGKWDDSESILLPIVASRKKMAPLLFVALQAFAVVALENGEYETAISHSKRAIGACGKAFGKKSTQYYDCMALLSNIYSKKGDVTEAEVCLSFLPHNAQSLAPNQPMELCLSLFAENLPTRPRTIEYKPNFFVAATPVVSQPVERQKSPFHLVPQPSRPQPYGASPERRGKQEQPQLTQNYNQALSDSPIDVNVSPRVLTRTSGGGYQIRPRNRETKVSSDQYDSLIPPSGPSTQESIQVPIHPSGQLALPTPLASAISPLSAAKSSAYTSDIRLASESGRESKLCIGVDFGLEFTSVAFAVVGLEEYKEDIITEWPGAGNVIRQSIPSVLYYGADGTIVGWGPDIAGGLGPDGHTRKSVQKVEMFKNHLDLMFDPTQEEWLDPPPLPVGKTALDVTADYLLKVRNAIRPQLLKTLGYFYEKVERDIRYCFTIPEYWDEAAQASFRSAIARAGYIQVSGEGCVTFVTENVATSSYCNRTGLLNLQANDILLNVFCGQHTCDLISHQIVVVEPLTMTQFTYGTGGACGPNAITRHFCDILKRKIRMMRLADGSKTAGRVYAKCWRDFEDRIRADFRNNGQKWSVDVGIETDFPEAGIEEGYLTFTNDEILSCFDPITLQILQLIKLQIAACEAKGASPKTVLVTGQFGSSEYIFRTIRAGLPNILVLQPMDSVAAKVKGAVTVGISRMSTPAPSYAIKELLAPISWIIENPEVFIEGVHYPQNRVTRALDLIDHSLHMGQLIFPKGRSLVCEPQGLHISIHMSKLIAPDDSLTLEDRIFTSNANYACADLWKYENGFSVVDGPNLRSQEIYLDNPSPLHNIRQVATITTNLGRKRPDSDFRKFIGFRGPYYLVEYLLKIYFVTGFTQEARSYAKLDKVESIFGQEVVSTTQF